MDHNLVIVVLSLLTTGCALADYSETCSPYHINTCLKPFVDKWGQQDGSTFFATGNKITEESMNDLCRDFDVTKQCVNGFVGSCDDGDKALLEGLYNLYDYVCGKGLVVYLRNQECLAKPALVAEISTCNDTATKQFQDIQQQLNYMRMTGMSSREDVQEQKDKFCSATVELQRCLKSSVSDYCSEEASDFTANIFNVLLRPALSMVDCGETGRLKLYSAIGVAVVLVTTGLVGWCVGMYVWNKRKAARAQTYSDRTLLATNELYYDDPPVYRSQVQIHQSQMQPGVDVSAPRV